MTAITRILHLEDDPTDAELVQDRMRAQGLAVEWVVAHDQAEFRHALQTGGFHLILADYALPTFDGLSALVLARELCPDVPVIVISGQIGEERAIELLKHGAIDFVPKTRLDRLALTIQRTLEEAQERHIRRRAEAALREAQMLLEKTFASLDQAVFVVDPRTRTVVAANPALDQHGVFHTEFPMRRKDGSIFISEITVTEICDEAGQRTGVVSVVRDITERQQFVSFTGRAVHLELSSRPITYQGQPARIVIARDVTERERAAATLLADVSNELAASLDFQTTLRQVARLALPVLGDACNVYLQEPDREPEQVAFAHIDPAREALMRELNERYRPSAANPNSLIMQIMRTGEPLVINDVPEGFVSQHLPPDPELQRLAQTLSPKASMAWPLTARGHTFGVIIFTRNSPGQPYTPEEMYLGQEIARRWRWTMRGCTPRRRPSRRSLSAACRRGPVSWSNRTRNSAA